MEAVVLTLSWIIFVDVKLDLPVSSLCLLLCSVDGHPELTVVLLAVLFSSELQ